MAANDLIKVWVLVSFYDENGLHKAGTVAYVKEEEFNPNYMKKIDAPTPGGSTELSELDDVDISGVTDGEILKYDAATEKWVNSTGGGGSGSVITNIYEDGDGHVESMQIDGTDYEFGTGTASISNISQATSGKIDSFDLTTPDGTDSLEFVSLLEDLEDVDTTGISDGEVLTYQNGRWTYSTPTKIENISETGGVVDSMDIDGATYNFATGGGGGGGSSLVVTLTATTGTTIDLAMMSAQSSASVNSDKTYAEMKAADDIIFKIVDTNQAGGQKWTLKPTGMHTLNVSADQALFFTFTVLAPGGTSLKIFRLEVGPWGNYFTLTCMA